MLSSKFIVSGLLAIGALAKVQPKANDSPTDVYEADFDTDVKGKVEFSGLKNGSIEVNVDLSGFPTSGGPFQYHVHEAPVPSDGNCTGTKGHLDPYDGNPKANSTDELEIGDLSGRYGLIHGTSINTTYVDQYLSLDPESPAFIGGLSITIHLDNSTRLACANITEAKDAPSVQESGAMTNGVNVAAAAIAVVGAFCLV